jgi:hypothetical protein
MAAHCNRCGAAIGDLIIGDCIVSEEEAREFPRDVRAGQAICPMCWHDAVH